MRTLLLSAVILSVLALAACGGDGDGDGPDGTVTPSPSPEQTPTPSPAATDTPASLPDRPAAFEDFPATVAGYLTDNGGSSDCLAELLEAWEMPSDGNDDCVAADLDDDGEDEYIVRFTREPGEGEVGLEGWLAGTIVIFDDPDRGYEVVLSLPDLQEPMGDAFLQPIIFQVDDLNARGGPEVLLTTSGCGAHTCSLTVYLLGYRDGEYVPILEPSPGAFAGPVTYPITEDQVRLEDTNDDDVFELMLREGPIGSVGAGPQREAEHTYLWDGRLYVLAETEYAPSDLRYFTVLEADDALDAGDYARAIELYREAADSDDLEDVDGFGDPAELRAYARFRIGLAEALRGDGDAALNALDEAIAADPDALHTELARRFRQGYGKTPDTSVGCRAVRDFVNGRQDEFAALWDYGYANPQFDPAAVCPF